MCMLVHLRLLHIYIQIYTDILGTGQWKECMSVDGVQLPTGYYFGITAATGDLSGVYILNFILSSCPSIISNH